MGANIAVFFIADYPLHFLFTSSASEAIRLTTGQLQPFTPASEPTAGANRLFAYANSSNACTIKPFACAISPFEHANGSNAGANRLFACTNGLLKCLNGSFECATGPFVSALGLRYCRDGACREPRGG